MASTCLGDWSVVLGVDIFTKNLWIMTLGSEWHAVVRIVWITGGVVAINNPGPEVQIGAGVNGRMLGTLRIPTYSGLFSVLRRQGFPIIGATFIDGPEEAQGLRLSEFRAMNGNKGWLVEDIHQQWREIAYASGQCNEMLLMDIASRIAGGLTYSEMRLHDLAEAYSVQLRGRLHNNTNGSEEKGYTRR